MVSPSLTVIENMKQKTHLCTFAGAISPESFHVEEDIYWRDEGIDFLAGQNSLLLPKVASPVHDSL